ncbi:hypothetical protein CNY89_25670, partial [Amaricoccus sp. HAR-UPW-R2A-40]
FATLKARLAEGGRAVIQAITVPDERFPRYRRGSVSIEMIEAVGERRWPTYFATLKARLAEGGRAVIQAITVPDERFPRYRRGSRRLQRAVDHHHQLVDVERLLDEVVGALLDRPH